MKTATIERPTCASCPYFQDFGEPNGRGWCRMFEQMARQHHQRTGACDREIEAVEEAQQEPVVGIMPQAEPAGLANDSAISHLPPIHEVQSQPAPEQQQPDEQTALRQPESVECPHCGGDGCGYCGYVGLVAYDRINWEVWDATHEFDYRFSHKSDRGGHVYNVHDIIGGEWIGEIERYRNQGEIWENSPDTYHWLALHCSAGAGRFLSPYSAVVEVQRLDRRAQRYAELLKRSLKLEAA